MNSVAAASKTSLDFTRNLDTKNNVIAEYVWIDGAMGVRSKAKTLAGVSKVTSLD